MFHYVTCNTSAVDIRSFKDYFVTTIETLLISQRKLHIKVRCCTGVNLLVHAHVHVYERIVDTYTYVHNVLYFIVYLQCICTCNEIANKLFRCSDYILALRCPENGGCQLWLHQHQRLRHRTRRP